MLRCDGVTAAGQSTVAVSLGEDLEVGDRIFFVSEKGIQLGRAVVLEPSDPVGIFALGVVVINCVAHRVVSKAEVMAVFVLGSRWHERQGAVWGKFLSKKSRSCELGRFHKRDALLAMTLDLPGVQLWQGVHQWWR